MVSADGDRIEARRELGTELERVHDQPHRRRGRINVFLLRDVFLKNVVLNGAGNLLPVRALLFGYDQIHGPKHRGGRIDGHRNRGLFQVDSVEENFHVLERVNGHSALPYFTLAGGVIGVVAHQSGQIEGDGKPTPTMFQKIFVTLVGLLRGSKAGKLPHGKKLPPIAGGVNAARVRRLAGIAEVLFVVPVFR